MPSLRNALPSTQRSRHLAPLYIKLAMWRLLDLPTGCMRISFRFHTAQSLLPAVAIAKASAAVNSPAFQWSWRWTKIAVLASANISRPLPLEALPSVPILTSTPASRYAGSERVPPQASFIFEEGQCMTLAFRAARILISFFLAQLP